LRLTPWSDIRQGPRGRWDDTAEDYRVLYCSNTEIGAFVEVLQDLRQNSEALEMPAAIAGDDEAEPNVAALVRERLKSRWLGILIPSHPDELVVDVHHGATRSFLEHALADTLADLGYATLKIGDLVGQIAKSAALRPAFSTMRSSTAFAHDQLNMRTRKRSRYSRRIPSRVTCASH
jgi:hypothetical protein